MIGNMRARLQPTEALKRRLGTRAAANIDAMLDGAEAVDSLAGLLDRAITDCLTADGRVDMKDVAHYVLKELRRNQKPCR